MGEYTVKLDSVSSGVHGVGQKAKRLGGLLSTGLPVPSGFVINESALEKFLKHNKILSRISGMVEESHSAGAGRLKEISEHIQGMIINGIMPDFLDSAIKGEYQDLSIGREAKEIGGAALDLIRAGRDSVFVTVRPSPSSGGLPSANFTGQMKTLVGLRGHQTIIDAIKESWASLFSIRAMLYRKRKRMQDVPSMAVIVQKSLEPEKAGFAYTSVPETGDSSMVLIEGSWGYSESIISGVVSPDEFLVSKETGEVVSKTVRKKPWLKRINEMTGKISREPVFRERIEAEIINPKEIKKIMDLSARVEKHFGGHPQLIEWAVERGRVFLIDAGHIPNYGYSGEQQEEPEQGRELASGICVFRGHARGTVRVFSSISDMERIEKGDILVTRMTIPELVPVFGIIGGVVTEEGSRSCHAAMLAREFGVPCVVLAKGAVSGAQEGQQAVLDATSGRLLMHDESRPQGPGQAFGQQEGFPPQNQFAGWQNLHPDQAHGMPDSYGKSRTDNPPDSMHNPPGIDPQNQRDLPDDGVTATGIKAIVSIPSGIGDTPGLADGVGLVRAEHIITETGKHPFYVIRHNPEEVIRSLVSSLSRIAKAFYPKPVWYRSIDIRSDEFRELEGGQFEPSENNPIMGWHGIRRSLDQPELLKIEIEIIERLYREGLSNIALGIPFLSSVEELRAVRSMCKQPIKIGVMVETPSAGLQIDKLCREGIAFAAIGLNDLTQLTLGVDRENSSISKLYSELNPAVINLMKHVLRTCREFSVETSVYGDFVTDPGIAESLVKLGVGSISTEAENIQEVRGIISRAERRIILENMRERQNG